MENPDRFAITEDGETGTTPCVAVRGEIDMESAPEFQRGLMDAIAAGRKGLVVDLSQATFVDTAALNSLVHALERLKQRGGGNLALVAGDERINALFEVARLDERFEIFRDRDEAVRAVAG